MTLNMSSLDRMIRIALVVVVAVLYYTGAISGTVGIILGVLAAVFALTSIVGFCPLYRLVGLSTRSSTNS